MTPPPPIPAATLILFRARPGAPPDLLMVERSAAMAFAAGAMVFPGGRVDPGDHALAARCPAWPADEAAARIAAIRETIEEAGLAVGLNPAPAPAILARLRAGLHAGDPFDRLLDDAGVSLDLGRLEPFARWRPAHRLSRVFDTRFYLAEVAANGAAASVDHGENVRLVWTGAAAMLREAEAGRASLIYPTRRNLERLARFADHAAAVADARAHPIRTIVPQVERRDGIDQLCIPDDLGYPVTAEPVDAVLRG